MVRQLLVHILSAEGDIQVVGEAVNGAEAVRLVGLLSPDVAVLDVHMPVMDGLEATRLIMEQSPRPVVVVAGSSEPNGETRSFRALEAGALAVLDKPRGPGSPLFSESAAELLRTVRLMAEVKVVTRRPWRGPSPVVSLERRAPPTRVDLVAVAASTGGPKALAAILRELPLDFPAPVLVVQHISPGFEAGLARWLDSLSPLSVRLAVHGKPLGPGDVVIAPRDLHVGVSSRGRVHLSAAAPIEGHRPSATYLFRAVAEAYGSSALGVVLTGMGRDGAEGLLTLRRAGAWTIAQDESTSVVYGMPREAASLGAVAQVLPLDEIASAVVRLTQPERSPD